MRLGWDEISEASRVIDEFPVDLDSTRLQNLPDERVKIW